MAKKSKKTEENKNLIYALIVVALVVVLAWAMRMGAKNYGTLPNNPTSDENAYPAISSEEDLNKATMELDNTDLNQMDKDLKGIDTDSASF